MPTKFSFEAQNPHSYDVEIQVDVPGHLHSKSGHLPFKAMLRSGQRILLGWVQSENDIEPNWACEEVLSNSVKTKVSHHDAKGVIMTQTHHYKETDDQNQLHMVLQNTHSYPVEVEIDFNGDGTVDMLGRQRPILLRVGVHSTVNAGVVNFTGEINVAWKWVQVD